MCIVVLTAKYISLSFYIHALEEEKKFLRENLYYYSIINSIKIYKIEIRAVAQRVECLPCTPLTRIKFSASQMVGSPELSRIDS